MSNNQNLDTSTNQEKINDKIKLLEDKLRFLTLTYISIVDNAIRQIAEKKLGYNQDKIDEDKTDIFGTKTFIKFLENENKGQKIISNHDKINFFSELKNQLFFPIDEYKTLDDALLTLKNKKPDHDNFYLIYAHIYALRQKCVHGVCNKITNSELLEKVLWDAEINKDNYISTAIHYKYLFLLMPNSFCNELINLFLALSKIQEKWQFSYNKIIELYAQNEIIFNRYFNVKSLNLIAKKNIKFFKQVYFIRSNKNKPSGSIIKNKQKFNLIGKNNYHNLHEIVKEFNKIVNVKNSTKVKSDVKICFEEMEKIIAIIIKINLILRIYFTDLYNSLNKKQKNKSGIKSLRNDIDHSNLLGIFIDHNVNQQRSNKKYLLKNWLDNLQAIEKFINKYSSNNSSDRNYLSLKNQLIQVLENKDFLIIKAIEKKPKNPKKPNIQLLRFTLKKHIEKNDSITRKKINKNLIKSKINSHRQKNLNYDYRLIKFHQYAKFKTILLRKLLNQKKIII